MEEIKMYPPGGGDPVVIHSEKDKPYYESIGWTDKPAKKKPASEAVNNG